MRVFAKRVTRRFRIDRPEIAFLERLEENPLPVKRGQFIPRTWMTGASIETMLELWPSSLRDSKARMRGLSQHQQAAMTALGFKDYGEASERALTAYLRRIANQSFDSGALIREAMAWLFAHHWVLPGRVGSRIWWRLSGGHWASLSSPMRLYAPKWRPRSRHCLRRPSVTGGRRPFAPRWQRGRRDCAPCSKRCPA